MRLLLALLTLLSVAICTLDAGIVSSKPANIGRITIKDATLAVSNRGDESLGAKQPYVLLLLFYCLMFA